MLYLLQKTKDVWMIMNGTTPLLQKNHSDEKPDELDSKTLFIITERYDKRNPNSKFY